MTKPNYVPFPSIVGIPDGPAVARIAYDWLIQHPEQHDQDTWLEVTEDFPESDTPTDGLALHCGTTCCVGGLIGVMDGWSWVQVLEGLDPGEGDNESVHYALSISDHAAARLGLSPIAAYSIFYNYTNEQALDALLQVAEGTYEPEEDD